MCASKDLFLDFTQVLEDAGTPYCILAGYDDYPDKISSDIDFMVPAAWVGRLPALIAAAAARSGAHLVQHLNHETTASYFAIARQDGASVSYLHPDSSTDYRRHGRRWLDAERILERRRRHARGFWVPAPADAFAYYLIKKIDKGLPLQADQARQLTSRYLEDPQGAAQVMRELLPEELARATEVAARSGSWSSIPPLARLRAALNARAPSESPGSRLLQGMADLRRVANRVSEPTGLHIVFLGPDGSGKSSVISRVCAEMSRAFRRVQYQHLRPGLLSRARAPVTVTDPHAKPPRGPLGSTLKLLHFWADFALAAPFWFLPRKVRSTLLVFDRYYHDIVADPLRFRYGGSLRLARGLGRLVPQPDLVFILDAPPAVLHERKQEVSLDESARQRVAYAGLQSEFKDARLVDVSQPLDAVVSEVIGHIIAFQEARIARRLRGRSGMPASALADPIR